MPGLRQSQKHIHHYTEVAVGWFEEGGGSCVHKEHAINKN